MFFFVWGGGRSIFQAGWATGRHAQHEGEKWGRLRTLRNDVNKALEQARAAKVLGSSLEGQARDRKRNSLVDDEGTRGKQPRSSPVQAYLCMLALMPTRPSSFLFILLWFARWLSDGGRCSSTAVTTA